SWQSTGATAMIGWIGFAIIVPLAFGYTGRLVPLASAAVLAAALQGAFLRLAFTPLRMDRSLLVGAAWGAVSGALIVEALTWLFPLIPSLRLPLQLLWEHQVIALLTGAYIGLAVGGFQTYFHSDDRQIEAEAAAEQRLVDYGRDAHWLDPFVYGA